MGEVRAFKAIPFPRFPSLNTVVLGTKLSVHEVFWGGDTSHPKHSTVS